jgi:hypothetical protein
MKIFLLNTDKHTGESVKPSTSQYQVHNHNTQPETS